MITTALAPLPKERFVDSSGAPLVGGQFFIYAAGTTAKQASYTDASGTILNANPVVLDARGEANVWLDQTLAYKFTLSPSTDTDPPTAAIWTVDNVPAGNAAVPTALTTFISSILSSIGSTLVGYIAAGVGAVYRSLQSRLRDRVSVLDYGADPTGAADSSPAFNAALTAAGWVWIPDGTYKLLSSVAVASNQMLMASGGVTINAGTAGMTVFLASGNAFFTQLWDIIVNGAGLANITAFDVTNLRLGAGLFNCGVTKGNIGLILRSGCFGTQILNFNGFQTPNGIQILANCSVVDIHHMTLDNEVGNGGTGVGIGISIASGSATNIGINIRGGFSQGFDIGILDQAISTKIDGVYFELCGTADVSGSGCRSGSYRGNTHFGPSGPASYKMRNTDSMFVGEYDTASGARTVVFDVDSTNTNFVEWAPASAVSMNSPLGTMTYISQLPIQTTGTFVPVVAGSTVAGVGTYTAQNGKYTVTGGVVHVEVTVAWSAHTGTGNLQVTGLPAFLNPVLNGRARILQCNISGFGFTGPVLFSGVSSTGVMTPEQGTTGGVISLVPIAAAGTINISGSYELI